MAKDDVIRDGYKILQSVEIADMEVVLAENPEAAQPYMTWRRSLDRDFGVESHMTPIYGSDYLTVLREFIRTQSVYADNIGTERIYRGSPIADAPVTLTDCVPDGMKQDLEGKVVAIRADILLPEYRGRSHQMFLATGGFGCSPDARGRTVFGTNLYSGEHERWYRQDLIGVVNEAALPVWAQEKLAALRAPAEKESVMDKIREAKAAARKEPPAERKPKTHDKSGPEL